MALSTVRVATLAIFAMLAVATACSAASTEIEAGASDSGTGTSGTLQAVLEPTNALVEDFGDDWEQVGRWYTEGSMTSWSTGCSDFDRLGDIFNYGTPETVVWARGDDRMFQRTDDLGWDAAQFAATVQAIPDSCPAVEVGQVAVATTLEATSNLGSAPGRITDGDPNGQVVAIKLDAYPHPSPETDIATPEFEPGRDTWMIVATRHNVVSQLVFSPDPERSSTDELASVVAVQIDALLGTPVEASGPFEQAAPPPSVEPGSVANAELYVDPVTCANDGMIDVSIGSEEIRWRLTQAVPLAWRGRTPILGHLTFDGTDAEFTADVDVLLESFTVSMTTGAVQTVCLPWDEPEPSPDDVPNTNDRPLDCDDRPIEENRFPDEGQDVLELAKQANPQVIEVRPLQPLFWGGFDGGGRIVVELALGDVENADWQIFTCAQP